MPFDWILPQWPAPPGVRALSTTRGGGISLSPWDSLNLGDHVGDDPEHVRQNRALLKDAAGLPSEPLWLEQVHGCDIVSENNANSCADACFSHTRGRVCAVMTADCLPVLLCNVQGTEVAAVHAGWRGLAAGVLEQTLGCFQSPTSAIMAWLGPAIGPRAFEVGDDVRTVFVAENRDARAAFAPHGQGKWLADIYMLARQRLQAHGVQQIHGGNFCTFTDSRRFFSYRRDGRTGRMASLIWLES